MESLFSFVVGDADEDRLLAYLYPHTTLIAKVHVGRFTGYLLRTEADGDGVKYLAEYQAGRLQSGVYGCRVIAATETAALNALRNFVGDEIALLQR